MSKTKYEQLATRNSHFWLLVEYDNKPKDSLKKVYEAVTTAVSYLDANKEAYEAEKIEIMYDNLECLHYGLCTLMGVSLEQQIKVARGEFNDS